ncbi:MAG: DegV family protein [Candidatus Borkfalkiaceae bacterium]|nr:DegV family protein [Clostridia bacterium]MDY6223903.1 DegV family protein [Christensenellaceae bacterium]
MRKFIVTTDSGCDLPIELLNEREIIPIRLCYEMNGELVEDTMKAADCHEFYEKMRRGAVPKTSQINEAQFKDFFLALLKDKKPIIHISLGSAVSGTYKSAVAAAEELKKELGADILVLDSTLCSTGYGMLALKAAEMRDNGEEAAVCFDYLEKQKINVNTWYTTDELLYLRRSGRCSRAAALIGGVFKICPILNLDAAGHLIVQQRVRGYKQTIKRIFEIVKQTAVDAGGQTLYICHSDVPERAREFGEALKKEAGFKDVYYTYIGTIIGSNCGPGLVAAFYFGTPRDMAGYDGKE